MTIRQVKAIGKIGFGSLQVASGVLGAFGHGFLSGYCSPTVVRHLGLRSLKSGSEKVREGIRELKQ